MKLLEFQKAEQRKGDHVNKSDHKTTSFILDATSAKCDVNVLCHHYSVYISVKKKVGPFSEHSVSLSSSVRADKRRGWKWFSHCWSNYSKRVSVHPWLSSVWIVVGCSHPLEAGTMPWKRTPLLPTPSRDSLLLNSRAIFCHCVNLSRHISPGRFLQDFPSKPTLGWPSGDATEGSECCHFTSSFGCNGAHHLPTSPSTQGPGFLSILRADNLEKPNSLKKWNCNYHKFLFWKNLKNCSLSEAFHCSPLGNRNRSTGREETCILGCWIVICP